MTTKKGVTSGNSNVKTASKSGTRAVLKTCIDGVQPMVFQDMDSFLHTRTKLVQWLTSKYGQHGRFPLDLKYYEIPRPVEDDLPDSIRALDNDSKLKQEVMTSIIKQYTKDVKKSKDDKTQIYGYLESLLSSEGIQAVSCHKDFISAQSKLDPLDLWKIIIDTHVTEVDNFKEGSAFAKMEASKKLKNMKQLPGQTLLNFKEMFLLQIQRMTQMKCTQKPSDDEAAAMFMDQAASGYAQLVVDIQNQESSGGAAMPATVEEAFQRMMLFRTTDGTVEKSNIHPANFQTDMNPKGKRPTPIKKQSIGDKKSKYPCRNCGKLGHWAKECRAKPSRVKVDEKDKADNNNSNNSMYCSVPDNFVIPAGKSSKDLFIYDSGATGHLVNCKDYLQDIVKDASPHVFSGVTGKATSYISGDMPMFGRALMHPNAPINCISGPQIEHKFKVQFEQLKNYTVYISDTLHVVFEYDPVMRLYVCDLGPILVQHRHLSVQELIANKRDADKASIVLDIMRKLGFCSFDDLIKMLRSGAITNCPITSLDVQKARQLYGPPVASVKGKTTERKAGGTDLVERVPVKHQTLTMYSDVMHIDKLPIFLSVCKPINLLITSQLGGGSTIRSSTPNSSKKPIIKDSGMKSSDIRATLIDQLALIREHGFDVGEIHVDPASALVALGRNVMDVKIKVVGAGSHVAIAERAIRVVKERVRSVIHDLPYSLPKKLMPMCIAFVTNRLNSVPHGSGTGLSAREEFRGIKLDFKSDLKLSFGDYVQVYNNQAQKNSVRDPRTIGCIALAPTENGRGTWRFFNLMTGAIITSDRWIILPINEQVCKHLNDMYKAENADKHVKIVGDEPIVAPPIQDPPVEPLVPELEPPGHDDTNDPQPAPDEQPVDPNDTSDDKVSDSLSTNLSISMNKGIKSYGDVARQAMCAEIEQLHAKGTFQPVMWDKLAIAAVEKRAVASIDIEGAYLECDMEGPPVYMYLAPPVAAVLVDMHPRYGKYLLDNKTLVVKLRKALYGCVQSSKLWYKKLSNTLIKEGYVCNEHDACVFNKVIGTQCTIAVYVDDLLITHHSQTVIDREMKTLGSHFSGYKVQKGNSIGHLGMHIKVADNHDVHVDMLQYTEQAVSSWGSCKLSKLPGDNKLFDIADGDPTNKLSHVDSANFHSAVARLLYLAKRTRPDILVEISFLCSRVSECTHEDWHKLSKVFGYLRATPGLGIKYNSNATDIDPIVYSDAAYMCHDDTTSRTGVLVMMAGGIVEACSSKQKLVTKSSAEAELVSLCDGATAALVLRAFLTAQGYVLKSTLLLEDNRSAIDMVRAGKPTSKRSKHINMRFYFIKQHLDSGELALDHCPTEDMLADILTKSLAGSLFLSIRDRILSSVTN